MSVNGPRYRTHTQDRQLAPGDMPVCYDCAECAEQMVAATHYVRRAWAPPSGRYNRYFCAMCAAAYTGAERFVNNPPVASPSVPPPGVGCMTPHPAPGVTCNGKPVAGVTAVQSPTASEAGHPGFLKLLDEMRELHCRKAADYGHGKDPFANVRASARFGVPAWVGVMIRANDKMERIQAFIEKGSLKNESVEDSLLDLAAYALIALALRREEAAKADAMPADANYAAAVAADSAFRGILRNADGDIIRDAAGDPITVSKPTPDPLTWSDGEREFSRVGSPFTCTAHNGRGTCAAPAVQRVSYRGHSTTYYRCEEHASKKRAG